MGLISIPSTSLGSTILSILHTVGFFSSLKHMHDRDSHGGYWCIADGRTGIVLQMGGLGQVHEDKASKYLTLAAEKATRLASHPDQVSSFQSRDPEHDRYGGAIRCGEYILSFSGLPELMDEALMLVMAVRLNLFSMDAAFRIASISINDLFEKALALYDECEDQ